jgi:CheY-like chemotaxis protein
MCLSMHNNRENRAFGGMTEPLHSNSRVVVVEDHALHGHLLRQVLGRRLPHAEVELFADGRAALRRLTNPGAPTPALLVLDLTVPGRSGYQLLADRADDDRLADVPVAVLTSSTADADRERALALGATVYLHKPLDTPGFVQVADRLAALARPY